MENSESKADPIRLRTVFMGTSAFASRILDALADSGYNIVAVYTQPDRKAGRKRESKRSSVSETAEKRGLKVMAPERLDDEAEKEFSALKPDLAVVAAYGRIIPESFLEVPGFGFLNVHPSLLPAYRGPSPIQNAILDGRKETGTTVMLMDKGMDTGAILSQEEVAIGQDEKASELSERLAGISSKLLLEAIPLWIERKLRPIPQDGSKATQCQLIERNDGKLIWSDDADAIYDRFRALHPWPGVFSFWERNGINFRIKLSDIAVGPDGIEGIHMEGEVIRLSDGSTGVKAGKGSVILKGVQLEGKESMDIKAFLNGNQDFLGSVLK